MRLQQWKRLNAVGITLSYEHRQVICIMSDPDDSVESFWQRVERWKAGESVDGIDAEYEGGELEIIRVRPVSAKRRSQSDD